MVCKKCGLEKEKASFRTVIVNDKKYILHKCKQCESDYVLKWQKDKKDTFQKIQKRYRENHKDYFKKKSKKYYDNNREYFLNYNKLRYTAEKSLELYEKRRDKFLKEYGFTYISAITFGLELMKKIYKKYNKSCCICNSKNGLCVHHKDGIGLGNYKKLNKPVNNKLDNLLLVCRKCHMIIHDNLHNFK